MGTAMGGERIYIGGTSGAVWSDMNERAYGWMSCRVYGPGPSIWPMLPSSVGQTPVTPLPAVRVAPP